VDSPPGYVHSFTSNISTAEPTANALSAAVPPPTPSIIFPMT